MISWAEAALLLSKLQTEAVLLSVSFHRKLPDISISLQGRILGFEEGGLLTFISETRNISFVSLTDCTFEYRDGRALAQAIEQASRQAGRELPKRLWELATKEQPRLIILLPSNEWLTLQALHTDAVSETKVVSAHGDTPNTSGDAHPEEKAMGANLGSATLRLRTVNYQDQYFNCKLVFVNLESVLEPLGYRVESAETRQDGRGTAPALRISTTYPLRLDAQIETRLRLIDGWDGYFKHRLVFDDLEDNLKTHGFIVSSCSTREDGQHTPLAIRATLSRR